VEEHDEHIGQLVGIAERHDHHTQQLVEIAERHDTRIAHLLELTERNMLGMEEKKRLHAETERLFQVYLTTIHPKQ